MMQWRRIRRLWCELSLEIKKVRIRLTWVYRIESMKMETVIRSPQKGIVSKLVHKEGVCCPFILTESNANSCLGHL